MLEGFPAHDATELPLIAVVLSSFGFVVAPGSVVIVVVLGVALLDHFDDGIFWKFGI